MAAAHRKIVLTCVGGALIYDVIKALRSAPDFTVRLIGCDADPQARGRVLMDRFVNVPLAETDQSNYLAAIWDLVKEEQPDLILPLSEGESRVLAGVRDDLRRAGVAISVSSLEAVTVMTDKLTLMQRLSSRNVHSLDCMAVADEMELEAALRELGYPNRSVVVKPRKASGARGVWVFDAGVKEFRPSSNSRNSGIGDRDAIVQQVEEAGLSISDRVAMPFVKGPIYDVDCISVDGTALDVVPRLRQWREALSSASSGNRVEMNVAIIDYCRELCEALDVDGSGDFDVVLDEDGQAVVFDAGTRLSGSVGGAVVAGANIPAQLVRVLTGLERIEFDVRDGCVIRPFLTFAEIPNQNQNDLL